MPLRSIYIFIIQCGWCPNRDQNSKTPDAINKLFKVYRFRSFLPKYFNNVNDFELQKPFYIDTVFFCLLLFWSFSLSSCSFSCPSPQHLFIATVFFILLLFLAFSLSSCLFFFWLISTSLLWYILFLFDSGLIFFLFSLFLPVLFLSLFSTSFHCHSLFLFVSFWPVFFLTFFLY